MRQDTISFRGVYDSLTDTFSGKTFAEMDRERYYTEDDFLKTYDMISYNGEIIELGSICHYDKDNKQYEFWASALIDIIEIIEKDCEYIKNDGSYYTTSLRWDFEDENYELSVNEFGKTNLTKNGEYISNPQDYGEKFLNVEIMCEKSTFKSKKLIDDVSLLKKPGKDIFTLAIEEYESDNYFHETEEENYFSYKDIFMIEGTDQQYSSVRIWDIDDSHYQLSVAEHYFRITFKIDDEIIIDNMGILSKSQIEEISGTILTYDNENRIINITLSETK